MNTQMHTTSSAFKIAAISALILLATGTLIGWSHFGTDILLNAASAGLSWCF